LKNDERPGMPLWATGNTEQSGKIAEIFRGDMPPPCPNHVFMQAGMPCAQTGLPGDVPSSATKAGGKI